MKNIFQSCRGSKVSEDFFRGNTKVLAKKLIGTYLGARSKEGFTLGRIVETEAYLSKGDPACHAARGQTKRNQAMFGPPGTAYVYLIYGMYYCFNVVTEGEGVGEAVLVRALEPVVGLDLMRQRRKIDDSRYLCRGPGCLTKAMGIGPQHNTISLHGDELFILPRHAFGASFSDGQIIRTTRIGISTAKHLPLRYCWKASPYLSKVV